MTPSEVKQLVNRSTGGNVGSNQVAQVAQASPVIFPTTNIADAQSFKPTAVASKSVSAASSENVAKKFVAPTGKSAEDQQFQRDLDEIRNMKKDLDNPKNNTAENVVSRGVENKSSDNAWANSIKARESALAAREKMAEVRDIDYWRREQELLDRENALRREALKKGEKDSAGVGAASAVAATAKDSMKAITEARRGLASEVTATTDSIIVTAEKLSKMKKDDLEKLGVNVEEPFLISVRLNGKLIHVRVAKANVKGKNFLVPALNKNNEEVKEAILKSPIFKEFRYFSSKEQTTYKQMMEAYKLVGVGE